MMADGGLIRLELELKETRTLEGFSESGHHDLLSLTVTVL
jgi:hypothetical protein